MNGWHITRVMKLICPSALLLNRTQPAVAAPFRNDPLTSSRISAEDSTLPMTKFFYFLWYYGLLFLQRRWYIFGYTSMVRSIGFPSSGWKSVPNMFERKFPHQWQSKVACFRSAPMGLRDVILRAFRAHPSDLVGLPRFPPILVKDLQAADIGDLRCDMTSNCKPSPFGGTLMGFASFSRRS